MELGCPYGEAHPPPDTVWYDSMGNVVHTGSATLSNQNYSVPATVTRGGSYRCQATNAGGSVNYTVNLLVGKCDRFFIFYYTCSEELQETLPLICMLLH